MEDSVNPCPPEWLDYEDNALLRGDAIGDTAYTHRWILKCLCTITQGLPKYSNQNSDGEGPKLESEHNGISKESPEETHETETSNNDEIEILELDSDVEDAACQLWDMTAERDVSLHLLKFEEFDVLQLACIVMDDCRAPRLTEVMVGMVGNICCQEEGCERVLQKDCDEVLLSVLRCTRSTTDVPTLCNVMRLMRILLWHRMNRTPQSTWASCPLIKHLCQDHFRDAVMFFISNSLSDTLIVNLLEFLSIFLFICLPETRISVSSLYSSKDMVTGIIDILVRKSSHQGDEEQDKIVKLAITCLYAFIETPGDKFIQSVAADENSKLESTLFSYVEKDCQVESPEELVGEVGECLSRVMGIYQLLIPYVKYPSIIMIIGKVLALIHGEIQQYSVARTSTEERETASSSFEKIYTSQDKADQAKRRRRSSEKDKKRKYETQFSNPSSDECGWVSPPPVYVENVDCKTESTNEVENSAKDDVSNPETNSETKRQSPVRNHKEDLQNLEELKLLLEEYCYQLLAHWWSTSCADDKVEKTQKIIIDVLDQCHAHEVLFILKAVRVRDPTLVPKLQEQIIDSGSHQRLVALLAHMYQ